VRRIETRIWVGWKEPLGANETNLTDGKKVWHIVTLLRRYTQNAKVYNIPW